MPLLPFPESDLLLPGMTKDLHLYEPRYMSMLEMVMSTKDRQFGHVAVTAAGSDASASPGALCTDGVAICLPVIVKVVDTRELSIGAMVRIQAVQRAQVLQLDAGTPFLQGRAAPLRDDALEGADRTTALRLLSTTQGLLADIALLYSKLPKCKEEAELRRALAWVDSMQYVRESPDDRDLARAERLSWAAFVPLPAASPMETEELALRRRAAMGTSSTVERLQHASEWLAVFRSALAARQALASLDLPASASDS